MAGDRETRSEVEDKTPDEQADGGIDFVTLGMFIIGKMVLSPQSWLLWWCSGHMPNGYY